MPKEKMMLLQIYMIESDFWKEISRLTLAHVPAAMYKNVYNCQKLEPSPFPPTSGRTDKCTVVESDNRTLKEKNDWTNQTDES